MISNSSICIKEPSSTDTDAGVAGAGVNSLTVTIDILEFLH